VIGQSLFDWFRKVGSEMLQRNFAGSMILLAASAIVSAQTAVSPQQSQNSPNPNAAATGRLAPGSIPQQQPAWRPGQPVPAKPAQVAKPVTQPGAAEPTTGASIAWPGSGAPARISPTQPAAVNNAAIARPVNAIQPANTVPLASKNSMPIPQPLPGSMGLAGVDYRAGLLSVVAENAELGKLMRLIGTKTGAQIDVAADVATELVMAHLGPGTPNEVLTALLDSSHLTYIMIGEDKVSKVVIRRRYGSAAPPVVARHRNLGFPEPGTDAQASAQPEAATQSGEIRPAGEIAPPAISSRTRSPLMRGNVPQPAPDGQATEPDGSGQESPIENVDVRGQVGGTEAPDQPPANPPQL